MLAHHVEPERFHEAQVAFIPVVVRRQAKAVLPVALIEQTVEKVRLAVQKDARQPVRLADGQRAQREIAFDRVFAVANRHFVQVRVFRRPLDRVRDRNADRVVGERPVQQPFRRFDGQFLFDRRVGIANERDRHVLERGRQNQAFQVLPRHAFDPDRLPDA